MIRKQLPVYSPLRLPAILRAARRGILSGAGGREQSRESLRRLLKERYEAESVALFASGTHALTAAIELARGGDASATVALPAFTCYDAATAAIGAGAPLVLYDIDPETLGPDWSSLEWALENGASVIVASPLYGIPLDWERLKSLAARHDATVIEDAAQGSGARWHGRPVGSLGAISVLSFGRGKGWTGGGGGALLVRGGLTPAPEPPPPPLRSAIGSAGTTTAQWLLGRPVLYGIPTAIPWLHLGETHYKEPEPLRGMSAFSAALALATHEHSDAEVATRRQVSQTLRDALAGTAGVHIPEPATGSVAGWLRLPCRVPDLRQRDALVSRAHAIGVETSYPTGLRQLPAVQLHRTVSRPTPGADALAAELITFPTHSRLDAADIEGLTRLA